jgi:sarcosine oxidase subunit alpha
METRRIPGHQSITDKPEVAFVFNGHQLHGYAGEPIAAALLANGIRAIRRHPISGRPRGIYCGIGHCYECLATVDGSPGVRTCLVPLRAGMVVSSDPPGLEGADGGYRA